MFKTQFTRSYLSEQGRVIQELIISSKLVVRWRSSRWSLQMTDYEVVFRLPDEGLNRS